MAEHHGANQTLNNGGISGQHWQAAVWRITLVREVVCKTMSTRGINEKQPRICGMVNSSRS